MVKADDLEYEPDMRIIRGVEIKRPIVIGSIAQQLAKMKAKNRTHTWVVYVRGLKNEDLSYFIKCVVFQIHEDFPNPRREIFHAPFEVQEAGWGEFEVQVDIHFHGLDEIYQTSHNLKLYAADDYVEYTKDRVSSTPVVNEIFTELIIRDPPVDLYKRLYCGPARILPNHKYQRFWHVNNTADKEQESIQIIDKAHVEVTEKIKDSVSQFHVMTQLIKNYHSQLKNVRADIVAKKKKDLPPAQKKDALPNPPKHPQIMNSQKQQNPPTPSRQAPNLPNRPMIPPANRTSNMHQKSRPEDNVTPAPPSLRNE